MAQDVVAIQQLQVNYCHRVDRGSAAEVAPLFAEDAVLTPAYDGNYECRGRDEIERWYAFYHDTFRAGVKYLKHLITSMQVETAGDSATGCTYLLASAVSRESGEGFSANGTYFDSYSRVNNNWLFQTRRIEVEWMTTHTTVVETFPPLNFPAKD